MAERQAKLDRQPGDPSPAKIRKMAARIRKRNLEAMRDKPAAGRNAGCEESNLNDLEAMKWWRAF